MHSLDSRRALSDQLFLVRGLGVLLVVLVHVVGVDPGQGVRGLFPLDLPSLRFLSGVIHSFNMAVMIICAGAAVSLFGQPNTSAWDFARRKLRKLVLPMLVWAPVFFAVQELSRSAPHSLEHWLSLASRLPAAWFPPYSIFWFVHALAGCTVLAWLFKRFTPALGLWRGPLYLVLALTLRGCAEAWSLPHTSLAAGYLRFILFWNCFFALGMALAPWLETARQRLHRLPLALQAALPAALLALLAGLCALCPPEAQGELRLINGPLGFCMQFSLAVFLREVARRRGAQAAQLVSRWMHLGSISLPIYLFHIYFLSGMRQGLERLAPGAPLALHLSLGWLAGVLGPVHLYRLLGTNRAFLWSLGQPPPAPLPPEPVTASCPKAPALSARR